MSLSYPYKKIQHSVLFLLGIIVFSCYTTNAQITFNKTYDYNGRLEFAKGVAVMDDSSYLVLCAPLDIKKHTIGFLLSNISQQGNIIWQKEYLDTTVDYYQANLGSLIKTYDGEYVSTGTAASHKDGNGKPLLVKFKPNGDTSFFKIYNVSNSAAGYYCIQTADSGFAIVGYESVSATNVNILAIRTDKNGNLLWHKNYGGAEENMSASVSEINGKKQLIIGGYKHIGNRNIPWLIIVDSAGNILSEKLFSSGTMSCGANMLNGLDNNYIFWSCLDTIINIGDDRYPYLMGKLDASLNIKWRTVYNNPNVEATYIARQISDSGFVQVGFIFDDLTDSPQGWIAKTDKDGNKLWEHTYYTNQWFPNYFADFQETPDKGFIVSGSSYDSIVTTQNAWLIKLDSNGCLQPGCLLNTGTKEVYPDENSAVNIYPNPANDFLIISKAALMSVTTIYNLLGQQVYYSKGDDKKTKIDVTDFPNGIYFLRIQSENNFQDFKFVVQH